jgi:hypothetical protein
MTLRTWILQRRAQLLKAATDRNVEFSGIRRRWVIERGELLATCTRSLYDDNEGTGYKHRAIFIDVTKSGRLIASARFKEWDYSEDGLVDDFLVAADAVAQSDVDMARFVEGNWDGELEHPLEYGSIAVFERLVITCESRTVWDILEVGIAKEFKKSSMMVLKPFPLEFEGETIPHAEERLKRRQVALRRHYASRLGVVVIDGDEGEFMWRPLGRCPDPVPGRWAATEQENRRAMDDWLEIEEAAMSGHGGFQP